MKPLTFSSGLVAALLAVIPSAHATAPGDLCTGNPCVVSDDITIDADTALDFIGQSLVFEAGVTVRVGASGVPCGAPPPAPAIPPPRTLTIVADDITMEPGARILGDPQNNDSSDGDRALVVLEAIAGNVEMQSVGSNRAEIDVKADCETAGSITIIASGDALLDGRLTATASGEDAAGGDVRVDATGNGSVTQEIDTSASGSLAGGGDIDLSVGLALEVSKKLTTDGGDFGAGDISLFAGTTVTINELLSLDGGDPDGDAGELQIEAGTDVVLASTAELRGTGGVNLPEDCGDGMSITIDAGRHVQMDGDIEVRGGSGCDGGELLFDTRLDFTQASTSKISTSTVGEFGGAGPVDITTGRSAILGNIDGSAAGFAADIFVAAPLSIEVLDKASARGSGNPDSIGGRIELHSCTVDILSPDGELDARSSWVFDSFGTNVLKVGGLATITGDMRAASPTPEMQNVGNIIRYGTVPPSITGTVDPTAVEYFDETVAECGYCGDGVVTASLGEQCDDGGIENCDGCAGLCQRPDDVCGDGIVECGEECDDGNLNAGDGCEPDCTEGPIVEPTPSPTPTATPTPSPSPSPTPTPAATPTPSPSPAPTPDSGGLDFHALAPCRSINTITDPGPSGGTPQPLQGGVEREFTITNSCGVPATAKAVAAVLSAVNPTAAGFITLFPANQARPGVSAVNFPAGGVTNNNIMLPLATDGSGTIRAYAPTGQTHFIFDLTGYFE